MGNDGHDLRRAGAAQGASGVGMGHFEGPRPCILAACPQVMDANLDTRTLNALGEPHTSTYSC